MLTIHDAFARLLAIDPTLNDHVLRVFSITDIEQLATKSGLPFRHVRGLLYIKIFHRTWYIKRLLDPNSIATPQQRHWAQITLQSRLVTKGLRQIIPVGWPPPRPRPAPTAVIHRVQMTQQRKPRPTHRQSIVLSRYKF